MSEICPRCGRSFSTPQGLGIHLRYFDPEKGCVRYVDWGPQPITPEQEVFEELSDRNLLLGCRGRIKNLTRGQIKTLKRRGIIKSCKLTQKGLQMWEELKDETAKI